MDIVWFSFYQIPRMRSSQIMLGLLLLLVGNTVGSIVSQTGFLTSGKVLLFIVLMLGVILAYCVINLLSLLLMQLVSSHQRSLIRTEKKMVVSEAGLISETELGRSELQWSAIVNIRQTKKYILIMLSGRGAMVVPKRYFDSQAQAEKFYTYLHQRWENN